MKQSFYTQQVSKPKKPHVSAERKSHHQGSRKSYICSYRYYIEGLFHSYEMKEYAQNLSQCRFCTTECAVVSLSLY